MADHAGRCSLIAAWMHHARDVYLAESEVSLGKPCHGLVVPLLSSLCRLHSLRMALLPSLQLFHSYVDW